MLVIRIIQKFRKILNHHQKIRILELGFVMIIGGFMEMLSVSLIMPFMEAVMDPDKLMQNQYVHSICVATGINSSRTFLMIAAFILAGLFFGKNIFLVLEMYVQNRFVFRNMFTTQERLLENYLSRPYEFFLGVNSGKVLRVIEDDTRETFITLQSLLVMVSELIVSFILIGTVLIISPVMTLGMAAIMIAVTLIVMKFLMPFLQKSGLENQESSSKMKQWLMQAVQGIKEIKITRKEKFFRNRYHETGDVYVDTLYKSGTWSTVPRFFIEAAAMGSIFIVIGIMIYGGTPLEALVPVISGIAVAAMRLLPSVNRISKAMADMSFREPMVDKMVENLKESEQFAKINESEDNAQLISHLDQKLTFDHISYQYPSGEREVLKDASVTIQKGMSIGIIGSSGSGKTTAVDIMLGLLKPQKGKVLIDGTDIELDMNGWLSDIGYIPQQIFMLDGDIRMNVAFGLEEEEIDDEKVWAALKEASLDKFVGSLPEGLKTQLGERGVRLSGGQRQRIGIARALYSDPSVLFFDEATSALDNETEAAIMDSINHLHGTKTMIIIAHRLTTIEGCDAVFRVENGKINRER